MCMHFNPQLFKVSIIQTKLFGSLDFELLRFHCIFFSDTDSQLTGFQLYYTDGGSEILLYTDQEDYGNGIFRISIDPVVTANSIIIRRPDILTLCEVEVYEGKTLVCTQRRFIPACVLAQCDQNLTGRILDTFPRMRNNVTYETTDSNKVELQERTALERSGENVWWPKPALLAQNLTLNCNELKTNICSIA